MPWIWENPSWPQFKWDYSVLSKKANETAYSLGKLRGKSSFSGNSDLKLAEMEAMVLEVISTSEIEGEIYDRDSVRSSVAERLGIERYGFKKYDKKAEGIIDVLSDATKKYEQELTLERLYGWHSALFPTGYSGMSKINVGDLRGDEPMRVISGALSDNVRIHFEAPPREGLEGQVEQFLEWLRSSSNDENLDGLIRAAISKFWFVTLHPFDDGNGRLSRAISDMTLSQAEKSGVRLISLSSSFLEDRESYYQILEKTQRGNLDISEWIDWYLNHLNQSISKTDLLLNSIAEKSNFWSRNRSVELNERQRKVINKILDLYPEKFEGGITNKKYCSMNGTSKPTAARDLSDLVDKKIFKIGQAGGRGTYYELNI